MKSSLIFEELTTIKMSTADIELIGIEIKNEECRNMVIITAYRPPAGNAQYAMEVFGRVCNIIFDTRRRQDVVVLGDLNLNLLIDSPGSKLIRDLCSDFCLVSNINVPTRVTNSSATCLDVILTSINHISESGVILNSLSDHYPTFIVKKLIINHEKTSFQGRSYRDLDSEEFKNKLRNYNWGRFYAAFDFELAWNEMYNVTQNICDEMCPVKVFNIRNKRPAWYNDKMAELAANRDDFYKSGKRYKDMSLLKLAREYRNLAKSALSLGRSEYYREQIEANKGNPIRFWSNIKELVPGNDDGKITVTCESAGSNLCAPADTPDIINNFFAHIGPNLAREIPPCPDPQTRHPQVRQLSFEPAKSLDINKR